MNRTRTRTRTGARAVLGPALTSAVVLGACMLAAGTPTTSSAFTDTARVGITLTTEAVAGP